eukprot:6201897-Pleurochrysis_carterae.AAC.2
MQDACIRMQMLPGVLDPGQKSFRRAATSFDERTQRDPQPAPARYGLRGKRVRNILMVHGAKAGFMGRHHRHAIAIRLLRVCERMK